MVLSVRVVKGDITEQKADVCVSSLHRKKDMSKGPLATAISNKGGPSVQRALYNQGNNELSFGEVVTSPPGNLSNFIELMFVCLLDWQDGNEKVLFKSVVKCLQLASEKKHRSIAFPALGMGGLHYPPYEVAIALMEGIIAYVSTLTETSLETVYIALHDPNVDSERTFVQVTMAFCRGMQREMDLIRVSRGQESWIKIRGQESFDGLERTRPEGSSERTGALAPLLETGLETAASLASSLPQSAVLVSGQNYSVEITPGFSLTEGTVSLKVDLAVSVPGTLKKIFEFSAGAIKSLFHK
ncbi:unnamed protein product [Lymnaea stagnalis]|uniref:Macro domain-containing protein n=1 Tax=Lymnaea stagnalis TaxID=6523 RepID=A0AAV2I212_LYMST